MTLATRIGFICQTKPFYLRSAAPSAGTHGTLRYEFRSGDAHTRKERSCSQSAGVEDVGVQIRTISLESLLFRITSLLRAVLQWMLLCISLVPIQYLQHIGGPIFSSKRKLLHKGIQWRENLLNAWYGIIYGAQPVNLCISEKRPRIQIYLSGYLQTKFSLPFLGGRKDNLSVLTMHCLSGGGNDISWVSAKTELD